MSLERKDFFSLAMDAIETGIDFLQAVAGISSKSSMDLAPATTVVLESPYDPKSRSWEGVGGLRYRVPISDMPSERFAIARRHNVKILMDNLRFLCDNDELPVTKEEQKFFASYRFYGYEQMFTPFAFVFPPLYMFTRASQMRMPEFTRGRSFPFFCSMAIAEQYAEATYPAHRFLTTVLSSPTPLGDAARADWQRLSPLTINGSLHFMWTLRHFVGQPIPELAFGGDIAAYLKL